jgi:hypothetical protein
VLAVIVVPFKGITNLVEYATEVREKSAGDGRLDRDSEAKPRLC